MTEDEAKTKWCPFVRITQGNNDYHACTNRGDVISGDRIVATGCVGSACMAWRKIATTVDRSTGAPILPGKTYAFGSVEERYLGNGYCGLAGGMT